MNIILENSSTAKSPSSVDRVTTKERSSRTGETRIQGAVALDISGKVMDNTAYEGQGKTTEDVMQEAGQMDVALQKNFMTVMSNSMSDEDFAKLQKEGYCPGNMEIETVVTIVDQIKAALIKGGNYIEGYTDTLDKETLEKIMGSEALAGEVIKQFEKYDIPVTEENAESVKETYDKISQLEEINDGATKYMVRNEMEPTIDHIYRAQYSASADANKQGRGYYQDDTGYYSKKAENFDFEKLRPQMEKVIKSAGLEVSKETMADAKWLVEKGIPLTKETISALHDIKDVKIPKEENQIVTAAISAIADGKQAGEADLSDLRTYLEKAAGYKEDLDIIKSEAVDMVLAEGGILNLRNLKAAQLKIDSNLVAEYQTNNTAEENISKEGNVSQTSVSARLLLEEARLKMTTEVNLKLLRSGFSIDTAKLQQLVEALKQAEEGNKQILFGNNADVESVESLYKDTLSKVTEIPQMPAALVGKFALQITETELFTLSTVHEEGKNLQDSYKKAGESYEALMTAPRADMGDSIKKAFRNVDDILKFANIEVTEENRRAARILGYNQMEISKENIDKVKSVDITIRRVIEKMTPASTMNMIREGVNPLSMNMEELEAYLDAQDAEPVKEIEKYSEFLYKLQKNNKVTQEERDAFVGIYRLFRQLHKTDGAAIGTLVNQGILPTMENLLSAIRSNKKHGMDVKADESFAGISSVSRNGKNISEQIESVYYKKLSSEVYDSLDGGKMTPEMAQPELLPDELLNMLRKEQTDSKSEEAYIRQQAKQMREIGTTEDAIIKELLDFDQPLTTNNLLAAGLLRKESGKLAGKIKELANETENSEEKFFSAVEKLQESLTNEETAKEAYEKLQETFSDILEKATYEEENSKIDIREMSNLHKQLSLMGNLAKEENYEVPVNVGGVMTSINLKIIHNAEENASLTISLQTQKTGEIEAQFRVNGENKLSGTISSDRQETIKILQKSENGLKKELEQSDIIITNLKFIFGKESDKIAGQRVELPRESILETPIVKENTQKEVSTGKLYETAKIFIGYIQKGEGWKYENML